ncbi:hypothetical protein [Flexivirga oryzae]|uniref:Secretion/DNA translocation related CpaE-like protein n=1 Tax=Flexivirga oryzae TaxID=1794944 RepID=A0A839NAM8_9MICO|nr:hypothetical protein [Flexivirga oryzae]MBB2893044.1 secretion/DNA translocation related CpaE-like protein [Flexivirga oryzae]
MNDVMTIAVLGGGTGAGATTALVGLAVRAAAAGREVTVVDADPCGGGIDVAFGLETEPGVRWEDLLGSDGPLDGERLTQRLPARSGGPKVLSFGRQWCDLPADLLEHAMSALRQVSELVLVDLGRDLRTARTAEYDEVLLVSRGSPCGLAAAGATAQRLGRPALLLVRGMREQQAVDAAQALGLECAGCLPEDRHLSGDCERGLPAGSRGRSSYAGACDRLLRELLVSRRAAA